MGVVVDLFAGPGGWSTGLNMLGRAENLGIEWDEAACETARAAGHERLMADIALLNPRRTLVERGLLCWERPDDKCQQHPAVEGVIASPPCQGFSMAGKGKGRLDTLRILEAVAHIEDGAPIEEELAHLRTLADDHRSALVLEPLRWVLELSPEWTAWEQVPAVLPLWEACAIVLQGAGYTVWTGNVQAEQFGVPQTRKRAILLARKDGVDPTPIPTHRKYKKGTPQSEGDPELLPWVSMSEALSWGMTKRPSMTVTGGGTGSGGAEPFGNGARQGMSKALQDGDWHMRSNYTDRKSETGRGDRATEEPAYTLTGKPGHWSYVGSSQAKATQRHADEPAPTVAFGHDAAGAEWRLVSPQSVAGVGRAEREGDTPSVTVTTNFSRAQWAFAGAGATSEQTAGQIPREMDTPAHTITGKGTAAWKMTSQYGQTKGSGITRSRNSEPATTVTSKANRNFIICEESVGQIEYVNGTHVKAGRRTTDLPAPTVMFGDRLNTVTWQPTAANAGTDIEDMEWTENRPSPTIVGSFAPDVVAFPAYRKAGDGPRQSAKGSVRVTVQEAAVLQSFPADYPWKGSKTAQYRQVGDAVPPLLAAQMLVAVGALR